MRHSYQHHARMFSLLSSAGLKEKEDRVKLVQEITRGKYTSTNDLTDAEVEVLCKHLEDKISGNTSGQRDAADNLRKKILSCCHQLQWYARHSNGSLVLRNDQPVLDFARIDAFCMKSGHYHKPLNDHTLAELQGRSGLVFQFETMLKNYLKTSR